MYKRLCLISVIIFICLCGLCALGFHAINLHAKGLSNLRSAEFTAVAEQIRLDVKRKLDDFIQTEQKRTYTDYQYYYIPQASNQIQALLRSPLGDKLDHGLAYGHFQIQPDGAIIAPFYNAAQPENASPQARAYINNIKQNLLAALNGEGLAIGSIRIDKVSLPKPEPEKKDRYFAKGFIKSKDSVSQEDLKKNDSLKSKLGYSRQRKAYKIQSLKEEQQTQLVTQSRSNVELNLDNLAASQDDFDRQQVERQSQETRTAAPAFRQIQAAAPARGEGGAVPD